MKPSSNINGKEIIPGTRIKIIHLQGEDDRYDGRTGTVTYIDDINQLHGTWGSVAIIPETDAYEIVN